MKKNDPSLACLNRMKAGWSEKLGFLPHELRLDEIVKVLKKRYLQEILHTACTTIHQLRVFQKVINGEYDNHVDLYMDELAAMVKLGIKQRDYWRIDPSVVHKLCTFEPYIVDGKLNMKHFCEPEPGQRLELGKLNIDPDRIKVKRRAKRGEMKPAELIYMQITGHKVFPKRKVMFELASLIRKRYIQEKLAKVNTNEKHVQLFNAIHNGKYDDDVDLYIDELTEMLKEQIRLRKNWRVGRL